MNAIEVVDLTRVFNGTPAVNGISFSVAEGEIFGFLGPNGAGKTTTIRMLTGELPPSSGQIRVADCALPRAYNQLKPKIGVVFEYQNLYEGMTGLENLTFSAQLYSLPKERADELLEQVGLAGYAKQSVKTYSSGMKQRLLIARAWLHHPAVLFLDEPTRGLDPNVAHEIRDLIKTMASQGATIFLTTHYMEEADQLCRRLAFIDRGSIIALDTPAQLKLTHGERRLNVKLVDGTELDLSMGSSEDGNRLCRLITSNQILTLHSCEASLEEVFIKLTGRGIIK